MINQHPGGWMGRRGEGYVVIQFLLFAAIALAPKFWRLPVPDEIAFAGWGVITLAGFFAVWSLARLGRNLTPLPAPVDGNQLVTSGPYAVVRHPIYSAILVASLGYSLATGSLLALLATVLLGVLFDRKTRREETWLAEKHPEYRDYQARVKKLLPWIY